MDETMRLIRLAQEGDKDAREKVVAGNVGLVWSVVRHFANRGYEMEDLYQIGCIGLLKAIDKFNMDYEVRFSTYAVPMVTGEIKRFLRDDGMIKVSRSVKELAIRVRSIRERLTWELGREPGIEEIAKLAGASKEEVAASLEAAADVESLYRPVGTGDDQNLCLMDKLPDERQDHEEILNKMVLKQLLEQLDQRERDIILRRYFDNQTQTQIAEEFHISQVQVSRLEKKILRQMREYLER